MSENNQPITLIIFGASGDLTQRKLIPSLFSLYRRQHLPPNTRIVGYARRPYDDDSFRQLLREGVAEYAGKHFDPAAWETFAQSIYYSRGNLNEDEGYDALQTRLADLENGPAHRIYYLATAPEFFPVVVTFLGERFQGFHMAGIALVLGGVMIATFPLDWLKRRFGSAKLAENGEGLEQPEGK